MTSHIKMMAINWSEVSFSPQDFDQLLQLWSHLVATADGVDGCVFTAPVNDQERSEYESLWL